MAVRCNFADIIQAIEDKLVKDVPVTKSQVIWAVNNTVPHLNGEFDIVLRARVGQWIEVDGGSFDLRYSRIVEVNLRTQSIMEPGAGNKAWIRKQFGLADGILNSVGNSEFMPINKSGEKLTTRPIMPNSDLAPSRQTDKEIWGDSVCVLEIHYLPEILPRTDLNTTADPV